MINCSDIYLPRLSAATKLYPVTSIQPANETPHQKKKKKVETF